MLQYTGSVSQSTNRVINLTGSGGTIDASGTGSGSVSLTSVTGTNFNLVLTGTGLNNVVNGISTGTGTVTKNSTGTWDIGGASTYTRGTTINAGILGAETAIRLLEQTQSLSTQRNAATVQHNRD